MVCMSHEAKPHLPGAALMLLAVWFAMRYLQDGRRRDWLGLCIACGAAFGMVLSSLPIFVLIPLVELIRVYRDATTLRRAVQSAILGLALACAIYLVTNPYVRSNFGNSLAMYEIDRLGQGFVRIVQLTMEGAGLPVVIVGVFGAAHLIRQRRVEAAPFGALAGLIVVQFVLIGAGKPAEYGRFGIYTNTALALAAACLLTRTWNVRFRHANWAGAVIAVVWSGALGGKYLYNFAADASMSNTRIEAAEALAGEDDCPIAVLVEPAPYCMPPVNFAKRSLWLFPSHERWIQECDPAVEAHDDAYPRALVSAIDDLPPAPAQQAAPFSWERLERHRRTPRHLFHTPISWANKPIAVQYSDSSKR